MIEQTELANDALFMYLMKLRTAHTCKEIASLFEVSDMTVRRRIDIVRRAMKSVIIPKYVNYERTREELVAKKSQISHLLKETKLCVALQIK